MIIQLKEEYDPKEREDLLITINNSGFVSNEVNTQFGTYLICIGKKEIDIRIIGSMPGVQDVHRVSDSYKLVSSKWKVGNTILAMGDVEIGGNDLTLMAGPCSIESEEQVRKIATHLSEQGIKIMRGGVYKPRSSPYAFRGMGIEGLKMFHSVCKELGLKIITEVMQVSQIAEMHDYVDIFQVGARNSQNFNLLDELGKVDKPVLLKRGMSGTLEELLSSAEYIFSHGNEKIILCERGIRTFEDAYRNTFDINAIPILKEKSHLPVIADPSHGIGLRDHVIPVALAATIAGADGIIYEVHEKPEQALSDGQQTLNFSESKELVSRLHQVFAIT